MGRAVSITAWSAISPYGLGAAPFADGLLSGRSAVQAIDLAEVRSPDVRAARIPDFDPRRVLGKKGTRAMNRLSGLAVATVGHLRGKTDSEGQTGVVLGTTAGSVETMLETVRSSLQAERPYHIDPAVIPYGVMNGAAGQCAIWYGYRGPNATIAAGRTTGIAALNYARRLILTNRADTVLAGAAEEYTRARAWLDHVAHGDDVPRAALGEGCAMFALTRSTDDPDGDPPMAEVLGLSFGVRGDGDWDAAVGGVVRRSLEKAGLAPEDVGSTCASGASGAAGAAEDAALSSLSKRTLPEVTELIGETHAASAAFQVAAVLALAEHDPDAVGPIALITSTDPQSGAVAAVALRTGRR